MSHSKLIFFSALAAMAGILLTAALWFGQTRALIVTELHTDQERQLESFRALLLARGDRFHVRDGLLLVGEYVIEGNHDIPRTVAGIFGGIATVFHGDVRAATSLEDGAEVPLDPGVHERLLGGAPYRGEAIILGENYLVRLEPLHDAQGTVIGALGVGLNKKDFLADLRKVHRKTAMAACGVIGGLAVLAALLIRRNSEIRTVLDRSEFERKLTEFSVQNADISIYRIAEDARILFANRCASRTLGYAPEELAGMKISDVDPFYPIDLWPSHWKDLREKGVIHLESAHRTRSGRILPMEITAHFFKFGDIEYNFAFARDITERRRAEGLLQAEKEIFREIASGAPLGETFSLLCARLGDLAGGGPCSILLLDPLSGGVRPCAGQDLSEAVSDPPVAGSEVAADPPKETWSVPVLSSTGALYGRIVLRGTLPDPFLQQAVSRAADLVRIALERARSEEALRRSEEKFSRAFHTSPDSFALARISDGVLLEVNSGFCAIFGHSPEEASGKSVDDLGLWANPADRRLFLEKLETGEVRDLEIALRRKDGSLFTGLVSARTLQVGDETCILSIGRDISAQKKAETALRQSEERFRQIFEQNEDAIILLDLRTFELIDGNREAERLYGCTRDGLFRLVPWGILAPGDSQNFIQALSRLSHRGGFHLDRLENVRLDGSVITVSMWSKVIRLDDEEVLYCSIRDITEKVRIESRMKATQAQLIHANKMASLGMLVSGIAHEVNNPNNCILLNSSLLGDIWDDAVGILEEHHRECGDLNLAGIPWEEAEETVLHLLGGISRGSERIAAIVNTMRDFVRNDPKGLDGEVDLCKVVRDAAQLLTPLIHKHTDHLHLLLPEGLPSVRGSAQQIEQVVINLLANALQSLPRKSSAVHVEGRFEEEEGVLLRIRDEGRGMDPSTLKKIAEPFFSTRREEGGTGLGLFIAASIVEAHGGSIAFDSLPGRGTTVTLRFPAAESSSNKERRADERDS